ncbi:DeoR family transcriptional regulator [uncultured Cetobacterium sp.]|nr:DeoR family transcriptional regulator [uncultured Cetobacterium sp.]
MLAIQRIKEIENILNEKGNVVISSLSKLFKVSEETIRRDLDKLEKIIF